MGHSAVAFVIVIGVLVFVHELGHFLVARLCGVGVEVFSLGFGPKLLKLQRGRTQYCISAIPLGGYVKMTGEEPGATLSEADRAVSFSHKSLGRKSLIVAAGPFFNFFLAVLIYFVFYATSGTYTFAPVAGGVVEGSPAQLAGVQVGDIVREIDGEKIHSFNDIQRIISEGEGKPVMLLIQRGDRFMDFSVTPVLSDRKDALGEFRHVLGIQSNKDVIHKDLSLFEAFWTSLKSTYFVIEMTFKALGKMLDASFAKENLGGPLVIAKMAGEQARAGLGSLIEFIALLSINLGIINLFPIPVLDGGHLLFFGIEAVMGRPVSQKLREKLFQVGAAVLVTLMVFIIYNDIAKIFFNGG